MLKYSHETDSSDNVDFSVTKNKNKKYSKRKAPTKRLAPKKEKKRKTRSHDNISANSISVNPFDDNVDNFVWDNQGRDYRQFDFSGSPGVKKLPSDINCPFETFKTFFTDEILDNIVSHTNMYAHLMKSCPQVQEKLNNTRRSFFHLFTDVSRDEIMIYIAIQLLMGIIQKPHYHMYWSNDNFLSTPIFGSLMRRDRFQQIRKVIHFVDPLKEDDDNNLRKLDDFLNALRYNFRYNYIPEKDISVDEYLSLWKGRLKFKVYIPSKRERYGVKIFMLCESSTGYLSNFIVYTGADTSYPPPNISLPKPFDEYKNPSKIVLSLLDGFYHQGYSLAVDNYYSSPELFKALYDNKTDAFGTLRRKAGLPTDFWLWKPVKGVGEPVIRKFCDNNVKKT